MIELLGILGAIFFGISALPQALKVWKTGKTKDLSMSFLVLWALGLVFTWLYVILQNVDTGNIQWPLHMNYMFNIGTLTYLLQKKIRNRLAAIQL